MVKITIDVGVKDTDNLDFFNRILIWEKNSSHTFSGLFFQEEKVQGFGKGLFFRADVFGGKIMKNNSRNTKVCNLAHKNIEFNTNFIRGEDSFLLEIV